MAGLRPHERIRRHGDFQRVYAKGLRLRGRYATLILLPTGGASGRLGVSATKKLGGAVKRNRAKRLIREIFRRCKVAQGFDLVVVPKQELLDAGLTAIEAEYRRNLDRGLRQARRPI